MKKVVIDECWDDECGNDMCGTWPTLMSHKIFRAGILKVGIKMADDFLFLPIEKKKRRWLMSEVICY
jgi:hypothetical protein